MNPLYILLLILGSIFIGALAVAFVFSVWAFAKDFFINKKFPKDKKEVSEFIKLNKEFFKAGEKPQTTERGLNEIDRHKFGKFREFEKLRRISRLEKGTQTKRRRNFYDERASELPAGKLLSHEFNKSPATNLGANNFPKRKLKLSD